MKSYTFTHSLMSIFTLLALVASSVMIQPTQAAPAITYLITETGDGHDRNPGDGFCDAEEAGGSQCTLRAAIEEANATGSADETISLPAGTYQVSMGTIAVLDKMTMQGAGSDKVTIDGSASTTGFAVLDISANMDIQGVTFANCRRAILANGVSTYMNISNSRFQSCKTYSGFQPTADGGAIYNTANLNITNSVFVDNHSAGGGGAIYNTGDLTIDQTIFDSNRAENNEDGGAIYNTGDQSYGQISNSFFTDNKTAYGFGGAVHNEGHLSIETTTFTSNSANRGGAIHSATSDNQLSIGSSKLSGNSATGNGGGLYISTPEYPVEIINSTIEENSAGTGGGFYLEGGTLNIRQSSVVSNTAVTNGGGLFVIGSATTLNITNATISGNASQQSGGGAYFSLGTVYLSNVTLTRNTADEDGNNDGDGGGIYAEAGTVVRFKNTILADNEDESLGGLAIVAHDCSGTITADANILVGIGNHGTLCTVTGALTGSRIGSSSAPVDPRLDNLELAPNNTLVHPLHADSPAVDGGKTWGCTDHNGDPVADDQRGETRPRGRFCDLGAYESIFTPPLPVISIDNDTVVEGNAGTVTAIFTVSLSAPANWLVQVEYGTQDNSATTAGQDYIANYGDLLFEPGQTAQPVYVLVKGDTVDEDNEDFIVYLHDSINATISPGYAAMGLILDDDGINLPTVSIADAIVNEGNSGTTLITFTVSLSAVATEDVIVLYKTVDGTALAPGDYTVAAGNVIFAIGDITQTVTISVTGDLLDEADETFNVLLTGAGNATLGDNLALGTILDDDMPGFLIFLPLVKK